MNWLIERLIPSSGGQASLAIVAEPFGNAPPPQQISASAVPRFVSLLGNGEFMLSLIILVFGAFVIFMQFILLKKARPTATPADIMRVFSITVIIVGVCLAMTAGYRTEQVAPVLGIFGTIAGYLLGYMARPPGQPKAHEGAASQTAQDESNATSVAAPRTEDAKRA